ncbi:MAG TPA: class I SAM-dependent methyltransferase [Xanthobacteraceae bacterium]|nr:class I SAM-dependent methyltransferase [Xanthobacteraceae bacterium]
MKAEIRDAPYEHPVTIIEPPFNFNAPGVSRYAPEITGDILLRSLCLRLGWGDLSDKRLLDFGCGVRFARTIVNLGIEIKLYAGVDVNRAAINWLRTNVKLPNLKFYHFDVANILYHPNGPTRESAKFPTIDDYGEFDAVSMFSVITHQVPDDAQFIFTLLHKATRPGGQMYFTAFLDESIADYAEGLPEVPGSNSLYNPSYLCSIVERAGWTVTDIYKPINFQQFGFCCHKG